MTMLSRPGSALFATGSSMLRPRSPDEEPSFVQMRQVRVINDFQQLEITLSNNAHGRRGVTVHSLGDGNVAKAGVLVGDIILEVDGVPVDRHDHALEQMRQCRRNDISFSLAGKAHRVEIDKTEDDGRDLEITLENMPRRTGVRVSALGLDGLCARRGLQVGDLILSVNGQLVKAHTDAIAIIDAAERFVDLAIAEGHDTFDVAI